MEVTPLEILLALMLLASVYMLEEYRRMLTNAHKRYDELSDMVDKILKAGEEKTDE